MQYVWKELDLFYSKFDHGFEDRKEIEAHCNRNDSEINRIGLQNKEMNYINN